VLDIFQFPVNLISGVSRAWPAWLVPWAPLWRGRKSCLAQIKICDLTFSSTSICVPYKQPLLYHQFQQAPETLTLYIVRPNAKLSFVYVTVRYLLMLLLLYAEPD